MQLQKKEKEDRGPYPRIGNITLLSLKLTNSIYQHRLIQLFMMMKDKIFYFGVENKSLRQTRQSCWKMSKSKIRRKLSYSDERKIITYHN